MNGVYENAVLQALKAHPNLQEVVLCVDNDEGGIEAAYRLRDILQEQGYSQIRRFSPAYKDWNECLKAQNGVDAIPAVPHKRMEAYMEATNHFREYRCVPERLPALLSQAMQHGNYHQIAEFAIAGSAFFLQQTGSTAGFEQLRDRLRSGYRPHTDKGSRAAKARNLSDMMGKALTEIRRPARTREQSVQTAKVLLELADCAVKLEVGDAIATPVQTEDMEEVPDFAYG